MAKKLKSTTRGAVTGRSPSEARLESIKQSSVNRKLKFETAERMARAGLKGGGSQVKYKGGGSGGRIRDPLDPTGRNIVKKGFTKLK